VDASGVEVVAAYAGHQGEAMAQYLLVEGVAAVALALVVLALGRAARRHRARLSGRVTLVAGLGAAILPRWLGYTGAVLAVALIVSGLGYLLLDTTLAPAAAVSLSLLLIWVTGAGLTVAPESR
jgi:hypothetical protein